jgi:hypothetical protein
VYCYLQDENSQLMRLFPNRFVRDSFVVASAALSLPGKMRFQVTISKPGANETVACFATARDVLAALPAQVVGNDFEPLVSVSMQQVRAAFANVAGGTLAEEKVVVQSR